MYILEEVALHGTKDYPEWESGEMEALIPHFLRTRDVHARSASRQARAARRNYAHP